MNLKPGDFLKIMYFQAKIFEDEIDSNLKNNFDNDSNLKSDNSTVQNGVLLPKKMKNIYISSEKTNDKKKTKKFNFKSNIRMFNDIKQESLYKYFKMKENNEKPKLKKRKKKIGIGNLKKKKIKSTKKLKKKYKNNFSLKENYPKLFLYKSLNKKSKSKNIFKSIFEKNSNNNNFEIIKNIKSYQKLRLKFQNSSLYP